MLTPKLRKLKKVLDNINKDSVVQLNTKEFTREVYFYDAKIYFYQTELYDDDFKYNLLKIRCLTYKGIGHQNPIILSFNFALIMNVTEKDEIIYTQNSIKIMHKTHTSFIGPGFQRLEIFLGIWSSYIMS